MGFTSWGIRNLSDNWMRYYQPGLACYLRLKVVNVDQDEFAELGFVPSVTGDLSGVTDILVDPPPDTKEVSLENIGLNSAKLRFGAREFLVSQTFVLNQMAKQGYTDMYQVWNDPLVLGFYYNNRLFTIESITHEDVGGQPTLWRLVCNASDFPSPAAPESGGT